MDPLKLKQLILDALISEIEEQIDSESRMIASARETANSDTKSSAGDKYETTTAMMHLEQEKYSAQLAETLILEQKARSVNIEKIYDTVQTGAIAETSMGFFFIAVSGEDVEIDDEEYTPISLASPLGTELKGKKGGDTFQFRGKTVTVISVS